MGISKNPALQNFRGTIGNIVVRQCKIPNSNQTRTVLSAFPDMSNIIPSEGQKAQRLSFKEAQILAFQMLADPEVKAFYKERCEGRQRPHNVLISELLKKGKPAPAAKTRKNQSRESPDQK